MRTDKKRFPVSDDLFYGCEQGVVILSTHSLADELGMALERIIAVGQ
ncbi:hypothetical protein N9762_07325 [Gammaproteobacteria bacterium]|nr:hypothetical protein [Gammaproteobacteria bacterium]